MSERASGATAASGQVPAVSGRGRGPGAGDLAYTNVGARPCAQCRRPVPPPEAGVKGRRPRYCGYCRQVREALRFVRAALRRLEALTDPTLVEVRS